MEYRQDANEKDKVITPEEQKALYEAKKALYRKIALIIVGLTVLLTAVAFFVVPDPAVIQMGSNGVVNRTAPKLIAILVPAGLTLLFAILGSIYVERKKLMGTAGIGPFFMLILIVVNALAK